MAEVDLDSMTPGIPLGTCDDIPDGADTHLGDVSGDGVDDVVVILPRSLIGGPGVVVCTDHGAEAVRRVPAVDVVRLLDIDLDGRLEIVVGGTWAGGSHVSILQLDDGRLVEVVREVTEEPALLAAGGVRWDDDTEEWAEATAWTCDDHDQDGVRAMLEVRVTRDGEQTIMQRTWSRLSDGALVVVQEDEITTTGSPLEIAQSQGTCAPFPDIWQPTHG